MKAIDETVAKLVFDLRQISVLGLLRRPWLRYHTVWTLETLVSDNRMLRIERDSLLSALAQVLNRPGHVGRA